MTNSDRRARRARAARLLLSLHERGELSEPERWNWSQLDALPDWSLLDGQSRSELQRLCGAVLMAPLLRLWIDARKIRGICTSVGSLRFEMVLDSTPVELASEQALKALTSLDEWLSTICQNDIDDCLSGVGASVLCASVPDAALRNELSRTFLTEPAGKNAAVERTAPAVDLSEADVVQNTVVEAQPEQIDALIAWRRLHASLPLSVATAVVARAAACLSVSAFGSTAAGSPETITVNNDAEQEPAVAS